MNDTPRDADSEIDALVRAAAVACVLCVPENNAGENSVCRRNSQFAVLVTVEAAKLRKLPQKRVNVVFIKLTVGPPEDESACPRMLQAPVKLYQPRARALAPAARPAISNPCGFGIFKKLQQLPLLRL